MKSVKPDSPVMRGVSAGARWGSLAFVTILLISVLGASEVPPGWRDVKAWRGWIVAGVNGSEERGSSSIRHHVVMDCEVLLDEFDDSVPRVVTWRGRVVSSNLESSYHALMDRDGSPIKIDFETAGPFDLKPGSQVKLSFHGDLGWSYELTTCQRKGEVTLVMPRTKPIFRRQEIADICGLTNPFKRTPYPAKVGVLLGTGEFIGVPLAISGLPIGLKETWDWTACFEPTSLEELRLEIDEPGNYATWRPETTPERGKGSPLEVKATLVSSKGTKPNTPVKSFLWELQNTSAEKGVALNFPLDHPNTDFDLELEARSENSRLFEKNQKLEHEVEGTFTDVVGIAPYDWGGWSTLQVTAILVDGRRIIGKVKGKAGRGLRVPKREPASHIAEGWKKEHDASGDDKSDDEKVDGQKDNGDGFTLYEEYRGWVVDGGHVGGDPKKKDFFVLNLIGADAEPGIELFTELSQLKVHSKLRPIEMSQKERLMNGNHTAGAHAVDQHGVWVKTFTRADLGDSGADTPMTRAGVAGRPGITKGVGILARDNVESIFNQPFNLPASDTWIAFDRAIAHELLHSVGVEHHGNKPDYKIDFLFIAPLNPRNRLGRPYFQSTDGKPVTVLKETGADYAAQHYEDYYFYEQMARVDLLPDYLKEARKAFATGKPGYATPEAMAEDEFNGQLAITWSLHGLVGVEHGAHSGDQDCVMRYYFAKFYEAQNPGDGTLYRVTPGTERIGLDICHSGQGTGINGPDNTPQSRYGDAASDAGNCFEQICPNDAIPPRSVKK
jgi:hypothetical protein